MKTSAEIISELKTTGMVNYQKLSHPSALKHYEPVLNDLLKDAKSTFTKILNTPKDRITFENTLGTFFRQDTQLNILYGFLHHLSGTVSSNTTRKIIQKFQPKMVEYGNTVHLSGKWYRLLKNLEKKHLTNEQERSLSLIIRDMEIAGVHLRGKKKKRLEESNHQLSELSEQFSNNTIDSRKRFSHHFSSDEFLDEIPKSDLLTAEEEAKKRKRKGWVFTLSPPSYQAILTYCSDRKVRRKFWEKKLTDCFKREI